MDQKLRELMERALKVTTPLAEAAASHDTKFLNVLLGIYRVSFSTLRDIYYLSLNDETGASALDLTRKIIEYGVTVEYMIWKGKEKMAERFQFLSRKVSYIGHGCIENRTDVPVRQNHSITLLPERIFRIVLDHIEVKCSKHISHS